MKAIAIFSGKGGVGKSTITALFALALSKKYKVTILDLDVSTPSMPVLFGGRATLKNIHIVSSGFDTKGSILHSGRMLRSFVTELAKQAMDTNADICLIDMPPGTNDIHLEVCQKLKPSSFLLVVQPHKLSYEDAKRALAVFNNTGIPISGVIVNMMGILGEEKEEVLGLPVLANIPLDQEIALLSGEGTLDKIKDNPLSKIVDSLLEATTEVDWQLIRPVLFRGVSEEEYFEKHLTGKDKLLFEGLASWNQVRRFIQEEYELYPDKFLEECTAEKIERMLSALDSTNMGMFMVIKPPSTAITIFPGEIGMAVLNMEKTDSYYGVPRMLYQTDEGEVTLFPFEIMPVSHKDLMQYLEDKEHTRLLSSSNTRYLPSPDVMRQIEWSFGNLTHVPKDWEEQYKKLGITFEQAIPQTN